MRVQHVLGVARPGVGRDEARDPALEPVAGVQVQGDGAVRGHADGDGRDDAHGGDPAAPPHAGETDGGERGRRRHELDQVVRPVAAAREHAGYTRADPGPQHDRQPAVAEAREAERDEREDQHEAHARPGDTQYVLYAHANLDEAIGLPSPYPYAWSLMVRGIPGAIGRLDHLLASPRRPTWVVGWEPIDRWGLDPHHVTERLLGADYRVVGRIGRHPIWHARPGSTP